MSAPRKKKESDSSRRVTENHKSSRLNVAYETGELQVGENYDGMNTNALNKHEIWLFIKLPEGCPVPSPANPMSNSRQTNGEKRKDEKGIGLGEGSRLKSRSFYTSEDGGSRSNELEWMEKSGTVPGYGGWWITSLPIACAGLITSVMLQENVVSDLNGGYQHEGLFLLSYLIEDYSSMKRI